MVSLMMHVPDSFILITPRSEQLKYNNMIPPAMQKVYSQAALAQLLSFDLWRAFFSAGEKHNGKE
jgi:hypothetical protein